MHACRALLAAALIVAVAPEALGQDLDPGKVTCRGFLAADRADKAALIMWLRGHHAAKTGTTAYPKGDRYGAMLGRHCANHPLDNLVEVSERILLELDRGI